MARARRLRKGMYILPSMFTTANLAAGFYAILQAMQGSVAEPWHFNLAAIAIGFAVFFDGLDGTIARLTNTTSDFGKELDSLADVVTFGVAPAILAYMWGFRMLAHGFERRVAFQADAIRRHRGLHFPGCWRQPLGSVQHPVESAAVESWTSGAQVFRRHAHSRRGRMHCGHRAFRAKGARSETWWLSAIWLAFVLSLGFLMVSTWRFWSAKSIDFRSRHPFRLILLIGHLHRRHLVLLAVCAVFMALGVHAVGSAGAAVLCSASASGFPIGTT